MANGNYLPPGKKVVMEFEKGGRFEMVLNPDAPKTCEAFINRLSYTGNVLHARFSGTEFFFGMPLGVPSENIQIPKRGNVAFNSNHEKAVCVYYDSNIHASDPPFNYFADLSGDMEELEQIGIRIWHQGMEKVTVRLEDV